MAKCRIGHFAEAQILQALERRLHRRVRGAHARRRRAPRRQVGRSPSRSSAARTNLGEALRRDRRGRRDDPHQGRGRHRRHRQRGARTCASVFGGIRRLGSLREEELYSEAKELPRAVRARRAGSPRTASLPVVTFTAGRNRDAGRRGALHAARCRRRPSSARGSFSRRGPVAAREGDRRVTTHFARCQRASRAPRLRRPRRSMSGPRGRSILAITTASETCEPVTPSGESDAAHASGLGVSGQRGRGTIHRRSGSQTQTPSVPLAVDLNRQPRAAHNVGALSGASSIPPPATVP